MTKKNVNFYNMFEIIVSHVLIINDNKWQSVMLISFRDGLRL